MSEVKNQVEAALEAAQVFLLSYYSSWPTGAKDPVFSDGQAQLCYIKVKSALAALSHPAPDVPGAEEVEAIRARHEAALARMADNNWPMSEGRQDVAALLAMADQIINSIKYATMNTELIERLERILPGLQNSSSSAEDAMIRALPEVIAALKRTNEMTDGQINEMANRFLSWRLPEDFCPDAGIRFDPMYNVGTQYAAKHEPTGTNLFTHTQAVAMIRHMLAERNMT